MTTDDRLNRHLAAQASTISLTPADPTEIKRRGARRRNRRRVAVVACTAALGLVATSVATLELGDDPDQSVAMGSGATSLVPSAYDWTVVRPTSGLGYSRSQVQLSDGAVYGLSTAPGATGETAFSQPPHLYRSHDGAEWAAVELPAGLSASSLAASGDTLYAIGTAPAGGEARKLSLAASGDGGSTWSQLELPAEVQELDARFPGQISITQPSVAALDAEHLVASVVVTTIIDFSAIPESEGDATWEYTDDGIVVSPAAGCSAGEDGSGCPDAAAPSTTTVGPDGEVTSDTVRQAGGPGEEARTHSWDELGVPPELRDHVHGRTYLYASHDGAAFEPVTIPGVDLRGWGAKIVATDAGYHLFTADSAAGAAPTTKVLRSTDGYAWEPAGELAGSPEAVGVLSGRPAVTLFEPDATVLRVGRDDGSWATVDLNALVESTGESGVYEVAFGPLGMAAVVGVSDGSEDAPDLHLLHTDDGATFSRLAVHDHVRDQGGYSSGLSVTADAILLRLVDPPDGDKSTPPGQRVLVGTPTG